MTSLILSALVLLALASGAALSTRRNRRRPSRRQRFTADERAKILRLVKRSQRRG